ncbi:MAG: hypothetical protein OXP68_00395 [Anaerolineaceae bacterium]|nr:hypothetical protein [Anaerolineaceae bacterium]MDE0328369.1 hypothetical protein [Anaerolineaceae bacterium]
MILAPATLLLLPWRLPGARRLALLIVLLASLLTLGLGLIGNDMHGRYLVVLVPLHCVLPGSIGAGPASSGGGRLLVLLSTGLLLLNLYLAADPALQHDDACGMVRYYSETLSGADSVLAWSYAERYELAWYWRRYGLPAQLITLPEGATTDAVADLLPKQGRVALNQWFAQRADYRCMAPCLLAHGSTALLVVHTVYGMGNLLFDAPPMSIPFIQPFAQSITVDGVERVLVTARGGLPAFHADQALCLPILLEAAACPT